MSSQTKQASISGTQSPPLEATGSDQPMGVSSIDGSKPTWVSDKEQRGEYFKNDTDEHSQDQQSRTQNSQQKEQREGEKQSKKMGQSFLQAFEEKTT